MWLHEVGATLTSILEENEAGENGLPKVTPWALNPRSLALSLGT